MSKLNTIRILFTSLKSAVSRGIGGLIAKTGTGAVTKTALRRLLTSQAVKKVALAGTNFFTNRAPAAIGAALGKIGGNAVLSSAKVFMRTKAGKLVSFATTAYVTEAAMDEFFRDPDVAEVLEGLDSEKQQSVKLAIMNSTNMAYGLTVLAESLRAARQDFSDGSLEPETVSNFDGLTVDGVKGLLESYMEAQNEVNSVDGIEGFMTIEEDTLVEIESTLQNEPLMLALIPQVHQELVMASSAPAHSSYGPQPTNNGGSIEDQLANLRGGRPMSPFSPGGYSQSAFKTPAEPRSTYEDLQESSAALVSGVTDAIRLVQQIQEMLNLDDESEVPAAVAALQRILNMDKRSLIAIVDSKDMIERMLAR